jgi:hypothetical protein
MVKVVQAFAFIGRDREMYHPETDTPAVARTSNLNEVGGCTSFGHARGPTVQLRIHVQSHCWSSFPAAQNPEHPDGDPTHTLLSAPYRSWGWSTRC